MHQQPRATDLVFILLIGRPEMHLLLSDLHHADKEASNVCGLICRYCDDTCCPLASWYGVERGVNVTVQFVDRLRMRV